MMSLAGGEEGGLEKMLVDDAAEMERRNEPGHMTRDSASAVSAMQPAANESGISRFRHEVTSLGL